MLKKQKRTKEARTASGNHSHLLRSTFRLGGMGVWRRGAGVVVIGSRGNATGGRVLTRSRADIIFYKYNNFLLANKIRRITNLMYFTVNIIFGFIF